ncbi:MAG TPA: ABC transporter permease [Actinomycetota bacterium]|nr:ABC transporter permease [Actinomycetota bacterium]
MRAIAAIAARDYRLLRSYRAALTLDLLFGFLNLVIFFYISRTFDDPVNLGPAPSYFSFAAAGIALTLVLEAGSTGLVRRVREEQLTGTLEALVVQPIRDHEIAFGLSAYPFGFGAGRAVIYLLLAAAFLGLDLQHADWFGVALILVTSGVAFAAIGIALGALVLVAKRGEIAAAITSLVLGILGGAYFPRSVYPTWLRDLSGLIPIHNAFDGVREALFAGNGYGSDALGLLLFASIALPLATLVFSRALRRSRRYGSLSEY